MMNKVPQPVIKLIHTADNNNWIEKILSANVIESNSLLYFQTHINIDL